MSEFGPQPGRTAAGYEDNILASTANLVPKSITILATATDATNPAGVLHLRKGLILAPLNTGANKGMYVPFNSAGADGAELEQDAVVLLAGYEMNGVDNCIANAGVAGLFLKKKMIYSGTFDFTLASNGMSFSDGYYR